jgi:hypothetical protein
VRVDLQGPGLLQLPPHFPQGKAPPTQFAPLNEKHRRIREHLSRLCEDHSLSQEERKKKLMEVLRE